MRISSERALSVSARLSLFWPSANARTLKRRQARARNEHTARPRAHFLPRFTVSLSLSSRLHLRRRPDARRRPFLEQPIDLAWILSEREPESATSPCDAQISCSAFKKSRRGAPAARPEPAAGEQQLLLGCARARAASGESWNWSEENTKKGGRKERECEEEEEALSRITHTQFESSRVG